MGLHLGVQALLAKYSFLRYRINYGNLMFCSTDFNEKMFRIANLYSDFNQRNKRESALNKSLDGSTYPGKKQQPPSLCKKHSC